MVWYKTGAADDPRGKSGIAHFLEHLMFKGTRANPGAAFSALIAQNGGRDNAFTTEDYTVFHETVATDRLDLVMRLEADRMTGLVLDDAAVLPERDVILEERRMRIDNDPSALLREQLIAGLYLNASYRNPTIGWEHEMRKLGTADALAFYRDWYAPNNAMLIVAGDVETAEVRALAERHFGPLAGALGAAAPPARGAAASRRDPARDEEPARRAAELAALLSRAELPRRRDAACLRAADPRRDPRRQRRFAAAPGAGARQKVGPVGRRRLHARRRSASTTSASTRPPSPASRSPISKPRSKPSCIGSSSTASRRTRSRERRVACRPPRSIRRTACRARPTSSATALAIGRSLDEVAAWPDRSAP